MVYCTNADAHCPVFQINMQICKPDTVPVPARKSAKELILVMRPK